MKMKTTKQIKKDIMKFVGFPLDDPQGKEDSEILSNALDNLIKSAKGEND